MLRLNLPIDSALPEIRQRLEAGTNLVLQASPGSGKTTRVPPALLSASFRRPEQEILILEPRRLAAKYAARRVADELGEKAGETVGYQFRFENVTSRATRLRFLTEGMLMRRLIGDPELRGVAAVILDEFHERHLHSDVALAYLRWLQLNKRPELRIVVMSATLDAATVSTFLGDCPIVQVDSRPYPVTMEHLPSPPARHLEVTVKEAVSKALQERDGGDILVFLPGMSEIRRSAEALAPFRDRGVLILPLHGELSREEQDRALLKSDRTKVILATNVAETSLTIEGITTVIDSGLHRQASYSWWSGVPALKTRPISRASAIQRAGRAGRTAPGRCLRLYTQGEFNSRPPFETPEIQRADISQTLLELKNLGVNRIEDFPWFESPSATSIDASVALLHRLGALEAPSFSSRLTELGRRMVELPAHPRIGRLLLEAEKQGVLDEAATLAAVFSEGRLEDLDALDSLRKRQPDEGVLRAKRHLLGPFSGSVSKNSGKTSEKLAFSFLAGFPDRVTRKRKIPSHAARGKGNEAELVFSFGGSSRIEETGVLLESEYFIVLDIQEQQHLSQARSQAKVRSLIPIQPDWLLDLEPSFIAEKEELIWDGDRQRVVSAAQMTYDELVLSESRGTPANADQARDFLVRTLLGLDAGKISSMGAQDWIHALSKIADPEVIEAALARISLFAQHMRDAGLASPESAELWQPLLSLFGGKLSRREVDEIDWPNEIPYALLPDHAASLEQRLPLTLQLPSGRKARIQYKLGQAPWVESRLQDFLGMKTGPSLLNGRIPLTLHLLAPNQRAVQVTTDLASFWLKTYPELRPALSRRYPRHAWPENPYEPEKK